VTCNDCGRMHALNDVFKYETMATVEFEGFKLDDNFTYYQKITRHRCIECTEGMNDLLFLRMINNKNSIKIRRVRKAALAPTPVVPDDDAEEVSKMIDALSDYQAIEAPAIVNTTTKKTSSTTKRSNYSSSLSNNKK